MNKHKAFTIIELLISIVIIALLVGILLPSIAMVRLKAKETAQRVQFASIEMALDAFKQDYGDYPPSNFQDGSGIPGRFYYGAQKFTEALLGWDLQGFHPNTAWRRDGFDAAGGPDTYDPPLPPTMTRVRGDDTLFERRGPYLEVAKTNVFRLGESAAGANDGLYNYNNATLAGFFDRNLKNYVICDVFGVRKLTIPKGSTGEHIIATAGSPVLYYRANTSSKILEPTSLPGDLIYNCDDNLVLIRLGKLPNGGVHKLQTADGDYSTTGGRYLYDWRYKLVDPQATAAAGVRWPYRPDSYILISAGNDHEFGTEDDILNY